MSDKDTKPVTLTDIQDDLNQLKYHIYNLDYRREIIKNINYWLQYATNFYHEQITPTVSELKNKLYNFI